jgi:hypothetical protein
VQVSTELVIAIASGVLSLFAGALSARAVRRTRAFEFELERRQRHETHVELAARVLSQYRDPLLDAAQTLQSRIYNIIAQDYLARYLHCGDPEEERYARDYTLYAIAEYLCWVEILRRELRFLDVGDVAGNRQLLAHLTTTQVTFQNNRVTSPFCVFRGRQRAIAEIMMTPTGAAEGPRNECVGYATFCQRLDIDPSFAMWFATLRADVDVVARSTAAENVRLVRLQHDLIDLIDFLDPGSMRIAAAFRARLPHPQPADVPTQRSG